MAAAYDDFNRRTTGDHAAEAALLASVKMQRLLHRDGVATTTAALRTHLADDLRAAAKAGSEAILSELRALRCALTSYPGDKDDSWPDGTPRQGKRSSQQIPENKFVEEQPRSVLNGFSENPAPSSTGSEPSKVRVLRRHQVLNGCSSPSKGSPEIMQGRHSGHSQSRGNARAMSRATTKIPPIPITVAAAAALVADSEGKERSPLDITCCTANDQKPSLPRKMVDCTANRDMGVLTAVVDRIKWGPQLESGDLDQPGQVPWSSSMKPTVASLIPAWSSAPPEVATAYSVRALGPRTSRKGQSLDRPTAVRHFSTKSADPSPRFSRPPRTGEPGSVAAELVFARLAEAASSNTCAGSMWTGSRLLAENVL